MLRRGRTLYNLRRFVTPGTMNAAKACSTGNPPKDHQLVNRADPKIGIAFKNLFTRNDVLLVDFLNDVLREKPVVSVDFKIPELPARMHRNSRKGIVDVACKMEDESRVIVELRMNNVDNASKATYHGARLFSSQQEDEEVINFDELRPVMLVSITDYNIFPTTKDRFYSKHEILDTKTLKNELSHLKWVFMELNKCKIEPTDVQKIESNLEVWAFLFKYASLMSDQDWEALIAKKSVLQTAREALDLSLWNRTEKLAYTSAKMRAMSDVGTLAVQRRQIARNMLRANYDVAEICKITKLEPVDLVDLDDLEELEEED